MAKPISRTPRLEDVLGPLASAIVRIVMALGEATVGDVLEGLRRTQGRDHAYSTVMTIMGRLHDRGVLERDRRGRQYVYRSSAPEPEIIDRLSGVAVERLVALYGTAALRQFAVKLADLDPDLRHRLEMLAGKDP